MSGVHFDPLGILEGRQLSSVTFVMDYLQLSFDGPVLTAYTLPSVLVTGVGYLSGQTGYCDALRSCIGSLVRKAFSREGEHIRLDFENGSTILISLRDEDSKGPEAAEFVDHAANPETWVVYKVSS
jgi:hypothetical protein